MLVFTGGSGEVREGLVQEILTVIPEGKIIWEAPQKAQQLYFIELVGANVNMGNIAPNEVIPLETMRLGLRGDTFHLFLDKETTLVNRYWSDWTILWVILFLRNILPKNLSGRG